jgi:hypothetical protein
VLAFDPSTIVHEADSTLHKNAKKELQACVTAALLRDPPACKGVNVMSIVVRCKTSLPNEGAKKGEGFLLKEESWGFLSGKRCRRLEQPLGFCAIP